MVNRSWHFFPVAGEPSPGRDIPGQHLGDGWVAGEITCTFPAVESHMQRRQALKGTVPVSMGGLKLSGDQTQGCGWENCSSWI